MLQHNRCPDSLTEQWQESNNKGYRELLQNYDEKGEKLDYLEIQNYNEFEEVNQLKNAENLWTKREYNGIVI